MPDEATKHAAIGAPIVEVRIDKWLWAARFYKTRSLAQQAIDGGRVLVGGERVKLSRLTRVGDELRIRIGDDERTVNVLQVSGQRGPAPAAQSLYCESPESIARRAQRQQARRLFVEPAAAIEGGRPTKRDRRRLGRVASGEPG